jgi:hypothetical protein
MTSGVGAGASPAVVWPMLVMGLLFLAGGLAAYTGRWTSWAAHGGGYTAFGLAWLGASLVLMRLVAPLAALDVPVATAAAAVLGAIMVLCVVVGALSPFWMWRRLQPRWYRSWAAMGRPVRRSSPRGRG